MTKRTNRQFQKKRRVRTLAVHAGLGVTMAALAAGVGYASLRIVQGQPLLPALPSLRGFPPFSQPAQPSSLSGVEARLDGGFSAAAGGEAALAALAPLPAEAQTLSAVWNTAAPLAQASPTVGDTRLLAVPENGRVSDDYFRDALFIGDSVTQG